MPTYRTGWGDIELLQQKPNLSLFEVNGYKKKKEPQYYTRFYIKETYELHCHEEATSS